MKNLMVSLTLIFSILLISGPLLAHHGEANYDTTKVVSVKGTGTDFRFINPHVQIYLDVKNDRGEIEKWAGEARSPAMFGRDGGWGKTTSKIGLPFTVDGYLMTKIDKVLRLSRIVIQES